MLDISWRLIKVMGLVGLLISGILNLGLTRRDLPPPGLDVGPGRVGQLQLRSSAATTPTVVLNEVAWGGSAASAADEWLELLNTTAYTIPLDGWVITSTTGLTISLDGSTIAPQGYYLIERTDDDTVRDMPADLIANFGRGLTNQGSVLYLSAGGQVIDTVNVEEGGPWPAGSGAPDYRSMERSDPFALDFDANWHSNDGLIRNGQDADGNPLNGTPKQPNSRPVLSPTPTPQPPAVPSLPLLISEFLYDGLTPATEGDEFIELCNPNPASIDLTGYKVGDETTQGGGESMYQLPDQTPLAAGACLIVAKNGDQFQARFGYLPDFEVVISGGSYRDNPTVPNLTKYRAWSSGSWALANNADELLILGANDEILDSVAYRNGDFAGLGLEPPASAPEPLSLQRIWPVDTNSMPHDFVKAAPVPRALTTLPLPPATLPPAADLSGGMKVYWGDLHAHTSYSDGAGPPYYALASARAAGLHFFSITDHGWWLSSAEWAQTLTQTRQASAPGAFIALRGVEWTHRDGGHINIFNSDTLISRANPLFADLPQIYSWLAANPEVIAQFNHPDPTYGGTFFDFTLHPAAAQVLFLQEVGNNAQDYMTYEPSFIQSNAAGWQVAPTNNSDWHRAGWGADSATRTGIIAPALTEPDLLDAIRARRVFATEDSNLALSLRAGEIWMGRTLAGVGPIALTVDVIDPDPEPVTLFLYDGSLLVATLPFPTSTTQWTVAVQAQPGHFFWVKAVQADGDTAYSAPLWVAGQQTPPTVVINEILPAPRTVDWDGNGKADHQDEWIELFNPTNLPVGLGGWRLADTSRLVFNIPLNTIIPAQGYVTFYRADLDFALNNSGDTVTLSRPDGTKADVAAYNHSPGYDESWCRLPDGSLTWSDACGPSPNGPNWEQEPAGPLSVNIYEAKRLTYNAWVKVEGQITAPPDVFGERTIYIQDETSGIMVYLPRDHGLALHLGDEVEVIGNLRTFHGEAELVVDEPDDVDVLKAGSPPPPLPIETTALLEPYEGMLVMLQGRVVHFRGRSTFWIDDGTGWAKTFIRRNTGIKKPFIELGTPITTTGIVSQFSKDVPTRDDYRLLLRYQSDLMLPASTPTPIATPAPSSVWPVLLPETGY